jgi:hypothetical protein
MIDRGIYRRLSISGAEQGLLNRKVDGCGTTNIEQGLRADGFLRVFGAAKAAP